MPKIELVFEHGHWRWTCECGRKGTRYAFREHAEQLGKAHLEKAHSKPAPTLSQRLRERADSYSRDAVVLEATPGFKRLAFSYRIVRDELRKLADEYEEAKGHGG